MVALVGRPWSPSAGGEMALWRLRRARHDHAWVRHSEPAAADWNAAGGLDSPDEVAGDLRYDGPPTKQSRDEHQIVYERVGAPEREGAHAGAGPP